MEALIPEPRRDAGSVTPTKTTGGSASSSSGYRQEEAKEENFDSILQNKFPPVPLYLTPLAQECNPLARHGIQLKEIMVHHESRVRKLYQLVRVTSHWRHHALSSAREDGPTDLQSQQAIQAQLLMTQSARVVCCYRVPFPFCAIGRGKMPDLSSPSDKIYLSSQPVQASPGSPLCSLLHAFSSSSSFHHHHHVLTALACEGWMAQLSDKFLEQYTRYLRLLGATTLPVRHQPADKAQPHPWHSSLCPLLTYTIFPSFCRRLLSGPTVNC